tara:strand:- start:518 stop:715 length:198 start_codon:yes stop_codon:yes gene_type:complete
MKCENWSSCKECIELVLKIVFVAVFTWGVMSAVCCMNSCKTSCGSKTACCKTTAVEAGKPCSSGK